METNNLHQQAVDMMTWGLLHELNFKNILDKVNIDQVYIVITTKEYEKVLYPFNDIIEEYKK